MPVRLILPSTQFAFDGANAPSTLKDWIANDPLGLLVNEDGELYINYNANGGGVSGTGDGYPFYLKNIGSKRVKSIQGNFRYVENTLTLSTFVFWANGHHVLGIYDQWNNQSGYFLKADGLEDVRTYGTFNGVLKRTFQTPVAIEDILLKIGGRSGYSFTPIYFKDLVLELE